MGKIVESLPLSVCVSVSLLLTLSLPPLSYVAQANLKLSM